ncbi:MAG: hypothetical protein R3C68_16455 [Myxococcota bacterium]
MLQEKLYEVDLMAGFSWPAAEIIEATLRKWSTNPASKDSAATYEAVTELMDFLQKRAEVKGYLYTQGKSIEEIDAMGAAVKEQTRMALEGGVRMFPNGIPYRFVGMKKAFKGGICVTSTRAFLGPCPLGQMKKSFLNPKYTTFIHWANSSR